jgi:hypothetical protein
MAKLEPARPSLRGLGEKTLIWISGVDEQAASLRGSSRHVEREPIRIFECDELGSAHRDA